MPLPLEPPPAADPMDAIRAGFFVECDDLLESLRDAIAAFESAARRQTRHDPETIHTAFRAVHSVKGGAAAFALSALVGGNMLTVAAMPDLSRYIRTVKGAATSMVLSFPVATPLLIVASALPALASGETDIMRLVVMAGFGLPVLLILILSIWTINAANLYSASLSMGATFPRVPSWVYICVGGAIGGGFALWGIIDAFVPFLVFLGILIPPIAAIYVIDAMTVFRTADPAASIANLPAMRWPAVAVWIGSIIVALVAERFGITLTTVPMIDATIIAIVAYLAVIRLVRPRALEPVEGVV
ncbi:MAG: hypothetical protein CVT77_16960 [Alphaproteobacteria bacterium HGW-Alphaproteobacteria-16]|nr:MAG: hypothetical protein CVT77_16960 [Alphaproteobacteria bacterium HGW-Alphaproteobacteria-16]